MSQWYEGYRLNLVAVDVAWQWNAYADEPRMAQQVVSDGRRFDTSEQALIAGRAAVDEVLGRAI